MRGFKQVLGQVPILSRQIGQLVNLKPNVNVNPNVNVAAPINIELGNLPLSIGLFAGAGVAFLVKNELPKGWRLPAAIGGVGLAVAGVWNLFRKKEVTAQTTTGPRQPGSPIPPAVPTVDTSGNPVTTQVVNIPSIRGFEGVTGRILQPQDFETVDLWFWQRSYPVQIQLSNGSSERVDFTLELSSQESPSPLGGDQSAATSVDVSLDAGETKNVDVSMPTAAWGMSVTYVDVVLTARKRRTAGDQPVMLDFRNFVIS